MKNFIIDTAILAFIQLWHKTKNGIDSLDEVDNLISGQIINLTEAEINDIQIKVRSICTHYVNHYGLEDYEVMAVIDIPLKLPNQYLIVKDSKGVGWLFETIIVNNIESCESLGNKFTSLFANSLGGVIKNIIVRDIPEPPRIEGRGLSKDTNQNTTARIYREMLDYHGLSELDYLDILNYLDLQESNFFRRFKFTY